MTSSLRLALLASTLLTGTASAQTFNQFVGFGDSSIDSGYFKYTARGNPLEPRFQAARENGGAITPSAGMMNSQYLASYFGLDATPSSAGGSNYAVSGARISSANLGGGPSPNIVQQMDAYLAANGGVANPKALYLISGGGNDLVSLSAATQQAYLAAITPIATDYVRAITGLSRAGAQYIVVSNYASSNPRPTALTQGIWNALANNGVNFIPADVNAMRLAVLADPARFGFTSVQPMVLGSATQTAGCSTATNNNSAVTGGGFGLYCIPSTTPVGAGASATAFLNAQNSLQTSFYSDDQHFSPAGQKIQADYIYSLIVAPSQISFLTESTIQSRRGVTLGIQEQIDISQRRNAPGFNMWFNGDVSSLKLNNSSPGFPGDPSTPIAGTLGGSYTFSNNALIGAAVTLGQLDPTFTSGGGFRQQEVSASVFGAVRADSLWANAIMSFGWMKYDVNRVVPLGITFDSNQGNTHGRNFSVAALTGYDFRTDAVTHGPVAGVEVQSVGIDSFTETGSFTSLAFSNIGRTSTVSALGYRAAIDYGNWRPFAQVTWNHEFDNTANRTITATLTSVTAPSYSMPIVQLGRDWASAVVGTTVTLAKDWTGLAAFNAQLGQNGATNYGGRFGINYAFNSAPVGLPVKAKY